MAIIKNDLAHKGDFRRMQDEWDGLERRLTAIFEIIKELEAIILSPNAFPVEKKDATQRMNIMIVRKARLMDEQSEVENWLVENEAPGWTST